MNLNEIWIWGILRPGLLTVSFLGLFLSSSGGPMSLGCTGAMSGWTVLIGIHMDVRIWGVPAEYTVARWTTVSVFNVVTDLFIL